MAEFESGDQEIPSGDGSDDNNDNKRPECQSSVFVDDLFFTTC